MSAPTLGVPFAARVDDVKSYDRHGVVLYESDGTGRAVYVDNETPRPCFVLVIGDERTGGWQQLDLDRAGALDFALQVLEAAGRMAPGSEQAPQEIVVRDLLRRVVEQLHPERNL